MQSLGEGYWKLLVAYEEKTGVCGGNVRIEDDWFWGLGVLWKHGPLADRSTVFPAGSRSRRSLSSLENVKDNRQSRSHPNPITMANLTPTHVRSLYRSFLRELPPLCRKSSVSLHARLRESFSQSTAESPSSISQIESEQADQLLVYFRAQRMYTTLLERYNPSLRMETEDRVRLSARRVGLNMPAERKGN